MSYILLIEDNSSSAEMTIRILTSAGYQVEHALRGFDGAKLARIRKPALILMDYDLPDINGRTLALSLKKQLGGISAPPIVAVTAHTEAIETRMANNFGCSAIVSKPFVPEELLKIVQRFMSFNDSTSE